MEEDMANYRRVVITPEVIAGLDPAIHAPEKML